MKGILKVDGALAAKLWSVCAWALQDEGTLPDLDVQVFEEEATDAAPNLECLWRGLCADPDDKSVRSAVAERPPVIRKPSRCIALRASKAVSEDDPASAVSFLDPEWLVQTYVDGEPLRAMTLAQALERTLTASVMLKIRRAGVTIHGYLYGPTALDGQPDRTGIGALCFDFDVREMTSPVCLAVVLDFMRMVGRLACSDVTWSLEGAATAPVLTYAWTTDCWEPHPAL